MQCFFRLGHLERILLGPIGESYSKILTTICMKDHPFSDIATKMFTAQFSITCESDQDVNA